MSLKCASVFIKKKQLLIPLFIITYPLNWDSLAFTVDEKTKTKAAYQPHLTVIETRIKTLGG